MKASSVERHAGRPGSWLGTAALVCGMIAACSSSPVGSPPDAGADDASSFDANAFDGGGADAGSPCEGGASPCNGACTDLTTDKQHCGDCSKACPAFDECLGGQCCVTPPGAGVCTVGPQCGCSSSQNCVRIGSAPEECAANGGVGATGNCLSPKDCQHGLTCANGICEPVCTSFQSVCAQPNYVCLNQVYVQNGQSIELGYGACEAHCNPVFPAQADSSHAPCAAQQTCALLGNGSTACQNTAGSSGQYVPCTTSLDCLPGYDCVTGGAHPNQCLHMCRIGFADCQQGVCTAYASPIYDSNGSYNQQIGVCE
jgi:hypothetical protein